MKFSDEERDIEFIIEFLTNQINALRELNNPHTLTYDILLDLSKEVKKIKNNKK